MEREREKREEREKEKKEKKREKEKKKEKKERESARAPLENQLHGALTARSKTAVDLLLSCQALRMKMA